MGILMKMKESAFSSLHKMRLYNRGLIHGKFIRDADIANNVGPRTKMFRIHHEDLSYYPLSAYKSLLTTLSI